MNAHLIKKDLKRHRVQIYIWLGIAIIFTLISVVLFPVINGELGESMIQVSAEMGDEMGQSGANVADMKQEAMLNITSMYEAYYGIYVIFILAMFLMTNGINIFGKEVRLGTSEFLYTRPISRSSAFNSKVMVVGLLFLISFVVQTLFAAVFITLFKDGTEVDWNKFMMLQTSGISILLFFASAGILLISYTNQKKSKVGMAIGIIFGFFAFNLISKIHEKVDWLKYLSPFHYGELKYAENGDPSINLYGLLGLLLFSFAFIVLSKMKFKKMDLV